MPSSPLIYKGEPVVIENCPVLIAADGQVHFVARGRIDNDGSGPANGDPYHQDETSLKQDGKSLNAEEDVFIVVPPQVLNAVRPIVLGCLARVENLTNGMWTFAVVGDIGPRKRLGEMSVACAKLLGINPNPINGGEDNPVIQYDILPGTPAEVAGKKYTLQAS